MKRSKSKNTVPCTDLQHWVEGVLRKGIQKGRTSRTQFIKFSTAVISREKFQCEKVHEKIENMELY